MVLRFAGGHPEGGPGTSAGSQVRAGDAWRGGRRRLFPAPAGRPQAVSVQRDPGGHERTTPSSGPGPFAPTVPLRRFQALPVGPADGPCCRWPRGGHPGVGTRTRHQVRRTCLPATICASALSPCHSSPLPADHCKWSGTLLATARGGRGAAATQGPQTASGHPERGTKAPLQGQLVPWLDGCPPWGQATRVPASSTTAAGWAGEEPA